MKKKNQKYNYGECENCDSKMVAKRIKPDFWIRGKLVVIDMSLPVSVPNVAPKSSIRKRESAWRLFTEPQKVVQSVSMSVPVVDLRP